MLRASDNLFSTRAAALAQRWGAIQACFSLLLKAVSDSADAITECAGRLAEALCSGECARPSTGYWFVSSPQPGCLVAVHPFTSRPAAAVPAPPMVVHELSVRIACREAKDLTRLARTVITVLEGCKRVGVRLEGP